MSAQTLSLPVNWCMRTLAQIGRITRARAAFPLMMAAASWSVCSEALHPRSWRRTVYSEFLRALRQTTGGGLATALVTAALAGLALVFQALYWLDYAGQEQLEGTILVTVLVREVTPLLIGMVLLGRSGTAAITELGALRLGGQVRVLNGLGIDPFLVLVLPRALAFALAGFTLGVLFVLAALLVGFIAGSLLGVVQESLWLFLDNVVQAMQVPDFAVFPLKMLFIGFFVAMTACLTALTCNPDDDVRQLLPRGFVRGVLAIMLTSLAFSLAV